MFEITTKTILDGITRTLRSEFSDSRVFDDEVRQGLLPGAFNVILVNASQQQIVGERYRRIPFFDILYYPRNGREDCLDVADRLSLLLNLIHLPDGDLIRGTGLDFEIIDGVLHFRVRYAHNVLRTTEAETMDNLKLIRGG